MSDEKKVIEMSGPLGGTEGKGIPQTQMRMFRIPPADPNDTKAICPWCGIRISEMDLRLDPTPVGTVCLTFRCKNCQVLIGHQIVPPEWVLQQSVIDLGDGDVSKALAELRRRTGGH
jgi:hypothetical protein